MQVAVMRQMCWSTAPHFHLNDIFKANKLPEIKSFSSLLNTLEWGKKHCRNSADFSKNYIGSFILQKVNRHVVHQKLIMAMKMTVVKFY
jgi:hypothetical protein